MTQVLTTHNDAAPGNDSSAKKKTDRQTDEQTDKHETKDRGPPTKRQRTNTKPHLLLLLRRHLLKGGKKKINKH